MASNRTVHGGDFFDTTPQSGPASAAVKAGVTDNGKKETAPGARLSASSPSTISGGAKTNGGIKPMAARTAPYGAKADALVKKGQDGNYNGQTLPQQRGKQKVS